LPDQETFALIQATTGNDRRGDSTRRFSSGSTARSCGAQTVPVPGSALRGGFSDTVLRIVAVAELADAVGLVLPAATGVLPWLTPLAGVGLALTMVLAIVYHVGRREWPNIGLNLFLGALALFISYGRFVVEPF